MSKLRVNKCSRDYQYNILIICVFQLRNKLQLQRGHTLDVMMNVSGEYIHTLTFLRLKALSSSFSTAWIFLTLMIQRASFPGKHKLLFIISQIYVMNKTVISINNLYFRLVPLC